jgi:predicted NUDIX family NTP pyrophosphohydrolase
VLLAHPGGPFWRKRDLGAWTLPKGEIGEGEDALAAARREFTEETGLVAGEPSLPLTPLKQPSGKTIHAWAVEGDCDASSLCSNLFQMEWPPRSGTFAEFPEIDRAGWFALPEAREKILKGQAPFLAELEKLLGAPRG